MAIIKIQNRIDGEKKIGVYHFTSGAIHLRYLLLDDDHIHSRFMVSSISCNKGGHVDRQTG